MNRTSIAKMIQNEINIKEQNIAKTSIKQNKSLINNITLLLFTNSITKKQLSHTSKRNLIQKRREGEEEEEEEKKPIKEMGNTFKIQKVQSERAVKQSLPNL